jgi:prophage regulatory protein
MDNQDKPHGDNGMTATATELDTAEDFVPTYPVFIVADEVRRRIGLSQTSINRYVANGSFPKPLKVGPRRSAWLEGDVIAWQVMVMSGKTPTTGYYSKDNANDNIGG